MLTGWNVTVQIVCCILFLSDHSLEGQRISWPQSTKIRRIRSRSCGPRFRGTLALCALALCPAAFSRRPVSTVGMATAYVTLSDGHRMPALGLGVFKADPGQSTYNAVLCALRGGYRHIDTAAYYRNEADVGRAIRDCGVPRSDIFVTTKLESMGGRSYTYAATLQALQVCIPAPQ